MKKRVLSLALALALAAGLTVPPAFAAEAEGERGVLKYSQIIAPQYEEAGRFADNGLAAVKKDGKWGYIDTEGNVVIPFQYERAFIFSEGLAIVFPSAVEETYGLGDEAWTDVYYTVGVIDEEGTLTRFEYPSAEWDPERHAYVDAMEPVKIYRERQGLHQDWLDGQTTDSLFFHNGFVMLPNEGRADLMDVYTADGSMWAGTAEAGLYALGAADEGLIPVVQDSTWAIGWADLSGNIVKSFSYEDWEYFGPETEYTGTDLLGQEYTYVLQSYRCISSVRPFNQNLAPVWQAAWDVQTGETTYLVGFINTDFEWAVEPQFTNYWYNGVYSIHRLFGTTGLAMVEKDGKWGAVNRAGDTVIPFQYEALQNVSNGLIAFKLNGKFGYMDAATYAVAIPAQFDNATSFSSMGLAVVYDGSGAYLIDKKGKAIPGTDTLDTSTYFTEYTGGDRAVIYTPDEYVVIKEDGKYGYGHIEYLPALPAPGEMSAWAYGEVTGALREELVPTDLQNLYQNNITREEFSSLVVQAIETVLGKDIKTVVLEQTGKRLSAWQQEYPFIDSTGYDVIAAYALGIVNGRGDGIFDPYALISRQEAAALLMRSAKVLGMDTSNAADAGFADSGDVGVWFTDAVNFVCRIGVMNGTGNNTFMPLGAYTREQSYITIYRLFQAVTADAA